MPRLPVVGEDGDAWGGLLNEFLEVGHNSDGELKNTPAGDITADNVQDALNQLDTNKVDSGDVLSPDDETLEQSGTELRVRQPVTTFIEMEEMAAPSAPSANRARLYTRDNGSGKTQLVVRFASGAVQVIATEP